MEIKIEKKEPRKRIGKLEKGEDGHYKMDDIKALLEEESSSADTIRY